MEWHLDAPRWMTSFHASLLSVWEPVLSIRMNTKALWCYSEQCYKNMLTVIQLNRLNWGVSSCMWFIFNQYVNLTLSVWAFITDIQINEASTKWQKQSPEPCYTNAGPQQTARTADGFCQCPLKACICTPDPPDLNVKFIIRFAVHHHLSSKVIKVREISVR